MNNGIGKNFDTTLKYINDPTVSEYYVSPVNSQMDCPTMSANLDKINAQITDFTNTLIGSSNSAEQANLSQILDIKQAIANDYNTAIANKCSVVAPGTPAGGNGTPTQSPPITTAQGNNQGLLMALLVLAGLILITHKHKP